MALKALDTWPAGQTGHEVAPVELLARVPGGQSAHALAVSATVSIRSAVEAVAASDEAMLNVS